MGEIGRKKSKNESFPILRYEKKYVVSSGQILLLSDRIRELCCLDKHVGGEGYYNIRSLYFDDYWNSAYRENEEGLEPRIKYRIRMYDRNKDFLLLERKEKRDGRICKESALIDEEFCRKLLEEHENELEYPSGNRIVNKFLFDYYTRLLRPKIIVDYIRFPYVYDEGDVRVTFDCQISYSGSCSLFLSKDLALTPVMPVGQELMEIKYTDYFPDYLYQSLNLGSLREETFSKFFNCETYRRRENVSCL